MSKRKRILVATYHCLIDTSSGAAISLRDAIEALDPNLWEIRVLTGPLMDFENFKSPEDLLVELGVPFRKYSTIHKTTPINLLLFESQGIGFALWVPCTSLFNPNQDIDEAWLSTFNELLNGWNPDLIITYGGQSITSSMLQISKSRGKSTIFYLCNFAYTNKALLELADLVVVLSQFQQAYYQEQLGLSSFPLYPLIPNSRYRCNTDANRRFVTFVNPQPHKGVYIFAKIAEVLNRTRPDIEFLIVEGRGSVNWLSRTGAKFSSKCMYKMENTPNPIDYLSVTKIMLMPSVWNESFGRVAAEAMLNGIPTIGSNRGSLPEVIGDDAIIIDLPIWCTAQSQILPSEDEVSEWILAIEKLWDDEEFYLQQSRKAIAGSARWDEVKIAKRLESTLLSLI